MERFNYKKKYGQNFITDKNLINKIVNLVPITKNDLVIEVGPGSGALTLDLVNRAKNVIIYEIDFDLEEIINNKLNDYDNYKLIINDFLDVDIKKDIDDYQFDNLIFVSNLPYYVTTPIIKKFIDDGILCDYMVVMVQDEVADRLSAVVGSKDYGSLTVYLNAFYDIKKELKVNRKLFFPIPNVDSAVVVMKKKGIIKINNYEYFKKFVRDCFRFKRKNLRNNLKGYDIDIIESLLSKYNLSLSNRAEEIDYDIFIDIANKMSE